MAARSALGAVALELGFDFVLGRLWAVAGDDRERVERELGDGVAVAYQVAHDPALADLGERRQRLLARRRQHVVARFACRPRARRRVGGKSGRQLALPLLAAVDSAGLSVAAAVAGGRAAPLDGEHYAVAAVAAPADQAGRLQSVVDGVEIEVTHSDGLAAFDPVAGELAELAETLERGGVGCAELGLYLHDGVVTFRLRRRAAAAARRVCRAWSVRLSRRARRPPS
jgi:hypothetical protein